MIRVAEVDKHFGEVHALDKVSMNIKTGSIYGLVGTNGSGKTTILKHITGVLRQDSGAIMVADMPVYENDVAKEKMAFIPDELFFYGNYNLKDMGKLYSKIYGNWNQKRFEDLVSKFNLNKFTKIIRFSKGMQKQAAFSLAMATMPEYLILDEPVDGLDPLVRRIVWDTIVDDVAERQMTVLISSHNLKEIEGICDTVGILSKGHLVLERDLDSLKSAVHKVQVAFKDAPVEPFKDLKVLNHEKVGSIDMLIVNNTTDEIDKALAPYNTVILDRLPLSLEEIFIYELGGESDEYKEIIS